MKKIVLIISVIVFSCLSAFAAKPWGLMQDLVEDTSFSAFAIDNLIDKRPIRFAVSDKISEEETSIFVANIRTWPREVLRQIKEAGREEEFGDILPYLEYFESESSIQQVSLEQKPDVYLEIYRTFPYDNEPQATFLAKGQYPSYATISINSRFRYEFKVSSLHEIGHYFGLGDEYGSRESNHPEYSSDVNKVEKSIMQGGSMSQITCDDVDGFINLFDLRLAQRNNNQFSERAENGWESLCPSSVNIYQRATTLTRNVASAFILGRWDGFQLTSRRYEKGKLIAQTSAYPLEPLQVFAISPEDIVIRNHKTKKVVYVRTVLKGEVEIPQKGKPSSVDMIWEKEFSYPYPEYGGPIMKIIVKHMVDGVFVGEQEMEIYPDGCLFGAFGGALYSDAYYADIGSMEVALTLKDKQVEEFTIKDKETWQNLRGVPNQAAAVFYGFNDTRRQYKLPLSARAGKYVQSLMSVYNLCYDNLMSFYKNFYEPIYEYYEQNRHEEENPIR